MPRLRNLFDYSTGDKVHRPHQTLIDVPVNDSVEVITVTLERVGVVQIRRRDVADLIDDRDGRHDWEVITDLDVKPIKVAAPNVR